MEYAKAFLIGGCAIAGSKIVAKYAGPSLAPVVGGMPTGMLASYFLSTEGEKRSYYQGYIYSSILLAIAVFCIDTVATHYKNIKLNTVTTIGLVLWFIMTYVTINFFVNKKKK